MATSKVSAVNSATRPTVEDLMKLGGLDKIDPVPAALAKLAACTRRSADALATLEATRERSKNSPSVVDRREATRRLTKLQDELTDARADEDAARGALLLQAKTTAFAAIAPVLQVEHQSRIPPVEAALRQALDSAKALRDLEGLASCYVLHGASIAPARSPIAGACAEFIVAQLEHCLEIVSRIRETRPAS